MWQLMVLHAAVPQGSSIAADVWIAQWFVSGTMTTCITWHAHPLWCRTGYNSSCSNSTYAVLPVRERVAVYGAITASTIVLNFARIIVLFLVAHRAAATLHDRMLSSLLGAVPWLFDVIPIGVHFIKGWDKTFMDSLIILCRSNLESFCKGYGLPRWTATFHALWIPDSMIGGGWATWHLTSSSLCTQLLLRCIAVVLTAASANYWIFIPASILIVALLVLRTYYLRTATQIKWLESNGQGTWVHKSFAFMHTNFSSTQSCVQSPVCHTRRTCNYQDICTAVKSSSGFPWLPKRTLKGLVFTAGGNQVVWNESGCYQQLINYTCCNNLSAFVNG